MGEPGRNDVGIYDDAIFIIDPFNVTSFNANVDPSRYGWNEGAGKYMARLSLGVWTYKPLKHHASKPSGYLAFGQGDSPVTVQRMTAAGEIHDEETGYFGINLHRGGVNGTSSEGCLTIPPAQWVSFHFNLNLALTKVAQKTFPLILIEA
jgi:lysozyme